MDKLEWLITGLLLYVSVMLILGASVVICDVLRVLGFVRGMLLSVAIAFLLLPNFILLYWWFEEILKRGRKR